MIDNIVEGFFRNATLIIAFFASIVLHLLFITIPVVSAEKNLGSSANAGCALEVQITKDTPTEAKEEKPKMVMSDQALTFAPEDSCDWEIALQEVHTF